MVAVIIVDMEERYIIIDVFDNPRGSHIPYVYKTQFKHFAIMNYITEAVADPELFTREEAVAFIKKYSHKHNKFVIIDMDEYEFMKAEQKLREQL